MFLRGKFTKNPIASRLIDQQPVRDEEGDTEWGDEAEGPISGSLGRR